MTDDTPQGRGESIPDVFDRIGETTRKISGQGQELDEHQFLGAPPVIIEKTASDDAIRVVLEDGRVTVLEVDSQMRAEVPWPDIADAVIGLVNDALDQHGQEELARVGEVNENFGALVGQLGILQADLRDAFTRDMGKLG